MSDGGLKTAGVFTPDPGRTLTPQEREQFCRGRYDLFGWWEPKRALVWLRKKRAYEEERKARERRKGAKV